MRKAVLIALSFFIMGSACADWKYNPFTRKQDYFETGGATLTEEEVEDYVGGMVTGNTETGVTVTYQDGDGTIDFVVSAGGVGTMTTIKEGDTPVGGADQTTIDFGAGFDVSETPDTETNITIDPSEIAGHDLFTDFVGAEHIDWAGASAGTVHTDNYVEGHSNGGNCSAGSYPLGVNASGAIESCTDATTEIDSAILTHKNIADAHHTATVDTNLTEEEVEDFVGGMLGGTETGIAVTYQDATNDIDFVVTEADTLDTVADRGATTNQVLTTGGTLTEGSISVGTLSPSASFSGAGDIYTTGGIKAMEGLFAEAQKYGAGLEVLDWDVAMTRTNLPFGDATLTASTQVITDARASFTSAYENQFLRVISSDPSFTGATGEITEVLTSTTLVLSFATAGGDAIVDATDVAYVIYPHPLFFVGDNGAISASVGIDPDAKFEVHIEDGQGFHGFYVEDNAGIDQHQGLTVDTDTLGFDGIVGHNIYMESSVASTSDSLATTSLEINADNYTTSDLRFIDVSLIGSGTNNDIDVIHVQGLDPTDHLMHIGQPNTIERAYYDDGDGTTVDATTAFTSQGTDETIFENDNSIIYVANETEEFTFVGLAFSTESNRNINAEYYYCAGDNDWKALTGVTDTTDGCKTSGSISFPNPADRGLCDEEIDSTAFADTTDRAYIAIKRTRDNWSGDYPIENLVSIGGAEYLYMDSYGTKPIGSAGAPYACTASQAGMSYYDSTAVALLWCDGATWNEFAETEDITVHNNLSGLQGGTSAEYYHLTSAEHTASLATDTEAELEALLELSDLQGAVTDGQVPNDITIDLATTVTTNANLTGEVTSAGNATTIANNIVDFNNLLISGGETDEYVLSYEATGTTMEWKEMTAGTDDQTIDVLSFDTVTLSISLEGDGEATQTVDISAVQDGTGTDDQTIDVLSLGGTTLSVSLEGDGEANQTVDLAGLQDGTGTDDQTADVFSISGNNVQLSLESDGEATQTVDISTITAVSANTAKVTDDDIGVAEVYHATNWNSDTGSPQKNDVRDKIETMVTAIGLNTAKETNTDTQDLSLATNTISLVDGGSVDISTATAVTTNSSHSADNTQAHSDYLLNSGSDVMGGTLTADGLTLGANENITLGSQTLDHNGTDFVFNDTVNATALTIESNTIDFGDVTEDYVLTFNASTNTWAGEEAGGGSSSYTETFDNSDLSSGVLTCTHSLTQQFNQVAVYNNSSELIIPDLVTATSTSVVTVDLSSYGTITGDWDIRVTP